MTRGDACTATVESDHPQSNTTPPEFVIAVVELITRQSVGPPSCPDFVIEDVAVQDGLTGGLFTSCKEEQSGDGFEHALVFFYGCSVPAAFLAEHAPCLEVRDGVFDRSPDFA